MKLKQLTHLVQDWQQQVRLTVEQDSIQSYSVNVRIRT
ncbi:hypothetical protein AVDCRST_MAG94-1201 [uncultured Leptolyngbya sp.]|uniref:Uncharacterized protein n=1 Tax=uncultured Leptolyngbya sp. TaxID=332963 RepID=A0A6J4KUG8_9CYAN|nr:hypothetical protein AVDCRST_MAG94-1201 [uncultured Leptolyngbya sp.]